MLIVVLNDGETFSSWEGCNVFYVPPHVKSTEDIEQYIADNVDNSDVTMPVAGIDIFEMNHLIRKEMNDG